MTMHLNQPAPALRSFRADCSQALETILLRLLEKDPAKRYASALELRTAFESCHRQLAPHAQHSAQEGWSKPAQANRATAQTTLPGMKTEVLPPYPALSPDGPPASSGSQNAHPLPVQRTRDFVPPPLEQDSKRSFQAGSTFPAPARPARFWLFLLFIPYVNAAAFLWISIRAQRSEWLGWACGLLVCQGLLHYFHDHPSAQLGFVLTWLVGLLYGLAQRTRYEAELAEAAP
jgi:serine/threonine protein kinase